MIEPTQYRWLRLEPIDAWFFRDGRPSNRGEDQSDMESLFPPNSATIVGAIRAALARQRGWNGMKSWSDDLKPVLGDGFNNLGQLSFLGPMLMRNDALLWPMPRHVAGHMKNNNTDDGRVTVRFQPVELMVPSPEPLLCDAGAIRLPSLSVNNSHMKGGNDQMASGKLPAPADGVFVTTAGMSKILSGELPGLEDCCLEADLFRFESRVGIQRDEASRTTGQNAMYSPRYVRLMHGVSVVMGIKGVPNDWTIPTVMPLGGESRLAGIESMPQPPVFPSGNTTSGFQIAVSATPSHFKDTWWGAGPGDAAERLAEHLSGQVASVALNRPELIGGWNSVDSTPLPLRPFVKPGTVWWIESGHNLSGHILQVGDSTAFGYGLTLLSKLDE